MIKSSVITGKLINYVQKHRFLILIIVTFSSLFLIITAYSNELVHALYFGDDLRVGEKEFSVSVGPTQIAATEKGDVYVVWVDKTNTFFSSSHDNGTKFGTPKVLSENYTFSSSPQIAATEKGDVYVVWVDKNITSGDSNIIFRVSNDSGNNFAHKNELSGNEHLLSYSPQIAATEKGDVYVVWVDKNITSGENTVTFRGSNSSGLHFNESTSLNPGDSENYRLSLNLSAKDVNQLHAKIYYYDSDKEEIKVDFLFHGRDGTFKDNATNLFSIPLNTSSIKVHMWVHQNPLMDSSYSLYEAKIIPNTLQETTWTNNNIDMQNLTGNVDKAMSNNGSIKVDIKQGNATNWNVISTDFISVNEMKLSTASSPQIAATEKGGVYVIWEDKNSTFFTSNLKNQSGFGSRLLLSEANKLASSSQIVATNKDDVYVTWAESNVHFKEILDRSTIIGETIGLSNISSKVSSPQMVATEKGDVYILWISKNKMTDEEAINFKKINKFFFDRNR